jgi:hypothetical protein
VIVGLVAIDDVDDHPCLNFLFITNVTLNMYVDRFLCSHCLYSENESFDFVKIIPLEDTKGVIRNRKLKNR